MAQFVYIDEEIYVVMTLITLIGGSTRPVILGINYGNLNIADLCNIIADLHQFYVQYGVVTQLNYKKVPPLNEKIMLVCYL